MPLLGALLSWVGPLIGRALLALGFSVVTITGMNIMVDQLKSQLQAAGASMSVDVMNLFQLAGGNTAVAIIMGAINARVAMWMIAKATRILGTPQS